MSAVLQVDSGTSGVQVYTGWAYLTGWSFRAQGGSAAELEIINGTDATGKVIEVVSLADAESDSMAYDSPIPCEGGIYINRISGTSKGTVYLR